MKLFVTGGTGYLGTALLQGLVDAGHQVTVLTRRPPEVSPSPRVTWLQGDLAEGPPAEEVLHQHRMVIHAAALVKTWVRDRSLFDRVNVEAHDRLLERCYRLGVSKVIVTSSFLSLGPSPTAAPIDETAHRRRDHFLTDYERTKHLADEITDRWIEKGLPIVTLYPTVLYGPGSATDGNLVGKMAYWIRKGIFPGIIGRGDQVWDYAYLPDVVRGHLLAMERGLPGERYILGGHLKRQDELVRRLYQELRPGGRPMRLPVGLAEALGGWMERWAEWTGQTPELTRGVAGVYRHHYAYDSSKAERGLGYTRTPFDDAMAALVGWARGLRRWGGA